MKVRITKSSNTAWYNKRIGEVFDVYEDTTHSGEEVYFLSSELPKKFSYISKDNCVLLDDTLDRIIRVLKNRKYQYQQRMRAAYKNHNLGRYNDMKVKMDCVGELEAIMKKEWEDN